MKLPWIRWCLIEKIYFYVVTSVFNKYSDNLIIVSFVKGKQIVFTA